MNLPANSEQKMDVSPVRMELASILCGLRRYYRQVPISYPRRNPGAQKRLLFVLLAAAQVPVGTTEIMDLARHSSLPCARRLRRYYGAKRCLKLARAQGLVDVMHAGHGRTLCTISQEGLTLLRRIASGVEPMPEPISNPRVIRVGEPIRAIRRARIARVATMRAAHP